MSVESYSNVNGVKLMEEAWIGLCEKLEREDDTFYVDYEAISDHVTPMFSGDDTSFSDWKAWVKTAKPKWRNNGMHISGKVVAPVPVASDVVPGAPVSNMSALMFMVRDKELLKGILTGINDLTVGMTASHLADQLSVLIHNLRTITPQATMGVGVTIEEEAFNSWQAQNSADVAHVGPYLFVKLLLQAGAQWSFWEHPTSDEPYLLLKHNGVHAYCTSRYDLQLETQGLSAVDEAAEFAVMARGVKVSAKQIRLVKVPKSVYNVVHGLIMRYDIKSEKDKFTIVAATSPTFYGMPVSSALSRIAEGLKKEDTRPGTAADEIIDWMARMIVGKYPAELDIVVPVLNKQVTEVSKVIEDFASQCEARKEDAPMDKIKFLEKLAITRDVESALRTLRVDREKRNRKECPQISQYVQKNVASVYAPNMMPMFETHCKLKQVLKRLASFVPKEWEDYPVHVYGVAYDHMGSAIEVLPRHGKVQYFDILKQRQSNTVYTDGNVFDMVPGDGPCIVVDDTLVSSIPQERQMMYPTEHNASLFKLRIILSKSPAIVATKLSLSAFTNAGAVAQLLAGSGYRLVQVAKFGKLHNSEVFVVLSKYSAIARNRANVIMGDIDTISLCMQVANYVIMTANKRGVTCSLTPGMWRRIMCILPATYSWYNVPTPETLKYSGGAHVTGAFDDCNYDVVYDGGGDGGDGDDDDISLDGITCEEDIVVVMNDVGGDSDKVWLWQKGVLRASDSLPDGWKTIDGIGWTFGFPGSIDRVIDHHKRRAASNEALRCLMGQRAAAILSSSSFAKKKKVPKLDVNK